MPPIRKLLNRQYRLQSHSTYSPKNTQIIYRLCETDFKRRFNNHKLSFTHEDKKNDYTAQQTYMDIKKQEY